MYFFSFADINCKKLRFTFSTFPGYNITIFCVN